MSAPEVTVGSRWVTGDGKEFTVLVIDDDSVGVRFDDGDRGWVPLAWFADGTYTPATPPSATPRNRWLAITPIRWLAITPIGAERTYDTEGLARAWAIGVGGAWVYPLVPDMDATEWVEGA